MKNHKSAKLVLEDGSEFEGKSFGCNISNDGEVVFNTGMVGYPESLTDPSYAGQILVCTYPLIGNYGVPKGKDKFESDGIKVRGLIVSEYIDEYSHWQAEKSLGEWLKEEKIPAIFGIDTRALTKKLRTKGVMLGQIVINGKKMEKIEDPNLRNLAAEVCIKKPKINGRGKKTVLLLDCGVKENIIRSLVKRGVKVKQVPWNYDFSQEKYDGILLSNGPGDPMMCTTTILNIKKALTENKPIFGICLGNQIMALASGAKTYKLKFGHRAQNQPCLMEGTQRCYLTTQNHGFAVREKTLGNEWKIWFRNANDNTVEGIRHKKKPFMAVQFHPESTPGPEDTEFLFDEFVKQL
ncbi:glutamine-hydrolyzing carbamoyl-phosphate synthase small subunit [Patescibacteria group bacterium]|nr:glutamine-hydrolyzing carbamoyl-phosphate synthase small subunit [Patescibacteria group bacterium]MBU1672876.1 glutamine-hydrolyzing carbamoyl-phosphate synthase small subunit [Patescibacteria group bacterium]MBU1963127.1 glutamine-hydrolyzing carbamoyl-phosphate synthase small subunit [Patescibacteria group bacterium]